MEIGKYKPMHAWQSLEFTIFRAEEAMKKEGWDKLPPYRVLKMNGYSSLGRAISKYHGGFYRFRKSLNETTSRFPPNARQDLNFLINYAKNIMQQNNWRELPSAEYLQKNGYSNLVNAVCNFHGGISRFRQLLGETSVRTKYGDWKSLEFTLEQARQIMEAENWNKLPQQKHLLKKGYSNLANAILRYHGGYNNFRELLGETSVRIKRSTWQSLDFTLEQSRNFLRIHPEYETIPGNKILSHLGYSSLSTAISKYHGGFPAFRETLHQHTTGKSSRQELEDLLESYAGDD